MKITVVKLSVHSTAVMKITRTGQKNGQNSSQCSTVRHTRTRWRLWFKINHPWWLALLKLLWQCAIVFHSRLRTLRNEAAAVHNWLKSFLNENSIFFFFNRGDINVTDVSNEGLGLCAIVFHSRLLIETKQQQFKMGWNWHFWRSIGIWYLYLGSPVFSMPY